MIRNLLVAASFFVISGCGPQTFVVNGTERVVGTEGEIVVEEIEGGTRLIAVELQHLPPPNRLGDNLTIFVMWFVPEGSHATMASVLEYDEDERKAIGTATTPVSALNVVITAEESREVTAPSDVVVVRRELAFGG